MGCRYYWYITLDPRSEIERERYELDNYIKRGVSQPSDRYYVSEVMEQTSGGFKHILQGPDGYRESIPSKGTINDLDFVKNSIARTLRTKFAKDNDKYTDEMMEKRREDAKKIMEKAKEEQAADVQRNFYAGGMESMIAPVLRHKKHLKPKLKNKKRILKRRK